MGIRQRASLVLIQDQKILLVYRENERGSYYVFPGGGLEAGETPEQAVVREAREEAGITVTAERVLFESSSGYDCNTLILCHQVDKQAPVWQETHKQLENDTYELQWVPLSQLGSHNLLPSDGKAAVQALQTV